jgi:hypothetical protein
MEKAHQKRGYLREKTGIVEQQAFTAHLFCESGLRVNITVLHDWQPRSVRSIRSGAGKLKYRLFPYQQPILIV